MEFSEYVRAQHPALLRFATVLTGRTWLAEDLVSDVLGPAFERWDSIGVMDRPHAYIRRMIVNEHLSWRRRAHRTPDTEPRTGRPGGRDRRRYGRSRRTGRDDRPARAAARRALTVLDQEGELAAIATTSPS
jgi:DNA-directed RNA polymerase specialized sigma24 family protein